MNRCSDEFHIDNDVAYADKYNNIDQRSNLIDF